MLDFFAIFTKGGLVLWYFASNSVQGTIFPSINSLIRDAILQQRGGSMSYKTGSYELRYKMDNEFELIFVLGYQQSLQLSYCDKLLDAVHLSFRDLYKNRPEVHNVAFDHQHFDFSSSFDGIYKKIIQGDMKTKKEPKMMKSFKDSEKSKKNASLVFDHKAPRDNEVNNSKKKKEPVLVATGTGKTENGKKLKGNESSPKSKSDVIEENKRKMMERMMKKTLPAPSSDVTKSPGGAEKVKVKAGKKPRVWGISGLNEESGKVKIDYTVGKKEDDYDGQERGFDEEELPEMEGDLKGLEDEYEEESSSSENEEDAVEDEKKEKKKRESGMFSFFKGISWNKTIAKEDIAGPLEMMKSHLIGKNVGTEIAEALCTSISEKLEGKVLGSFKGVSRTVKESFEEALIQILTPKKNVNILRSVIEAKEQNRPFAITFCGVNGVGKSTNLAKIAYWLVQNKMRVLIAACDTFRAGAVEQLVTHVARLNAIHPKEKNGGISMVELFQRGYGKDAAGIALEAIRHAKDSGFNVVLIDTAGRMQDNKPLMESLAKLIKVNNPDLVLFVGEALVGNDAIDQVVKFNESLADSSHSTSQPRLIDGIVLTKFDTVDDKVGAAISMTYSTGQPIVFVGTGQTYADLRSLNVQSVVNILLK